MTISDVRPNPTTQAKAERCERCGLSHASLNVEINDRTLIRKVRGSKHRLKAYDGSFGFSAQFWDAHARDIDELVIFDEASGEVFHGKGEVFAQAQAQARRQTFSPIYGPQIVIPIHVLERFADAAEFQFWSQ